MIVGAGIVGLTIARECASRWPGVKVTVIDKEGELALHASGRNSGVIHAGFYYTADSMKAAFTVEGNRLLTEYCLSNGLSIDQCGKVVVARDEAGLDTLDELKRRGEASGVNLDVIDEGELSLLEPNAKTFERALFSPDTSAIDPGQIVAHMGSELASTVGVEILLGEAFEERDGDGAIRTTTNRITYRYLVNSAGLYADKIAHRFGAGLRYSMIPFKGAYMEYTDPALASRHIYPAPELARPFLGVHFTRTVTGKLKAGPTALPAMWRENYGGLKNFKLSELLESLTLETRLLFKNRSDFRGAAYGELKKVLRKNLIKEASGLVREIDPEKFGDYLAPGIRAQLIDTEECVLVMDFVVEEGERSTHILNAVSPAFTCSIPFSRYIVDSIEKKKPF